MPSENAAVNIFEANSSKISGGLQRPQAPSR